MKETKAITQPNGLVGAFELAPTLTATMRRDVVHATAQPLKVVSESALVLHDLLIPKELRLLRDMLALQQWVPVGINGMKQQNFNPEKDRIGSYRATSYDEEFAALLWKRVMPFLPSMRHMDDHTPTDWDGSRTWRPVGVNPVHRFIKYEDGGSLLPHYDAPFIYNHTKRTLMSLVLYLDKSVTITGGATRFLHDPQVTVPVAERDLHDWPHFAEEKDVRFAFDPTPGSALVFDHRILHDSGDVHGAGQKLLLRTDIDFERM